MNRFRSSACWFAFALAQVFLGAEVECAWAREPAIVALSIGLDGQYRTGYWTAVRIELQGGERDFRGKLGITLRDGDAVPVQHEWGVSDPITIPANRTVTLERYVKCGRAVQRIPVVLQGEGAEPLTITATFDVPAPLPSHRGIVLGVGPSLGVQDVARRRLRASEQPPAFASPAVTELPESSLGYDGVDMVVVATSDAEGLSRISDRQLKALRRWVMLGGRMILCVGARGEEVFGDQGRWRDLAPGKFERVVAVRNTSPLETYTGAIQGLAASRSADGIPMTLLTDVRGKVELFDLAPEGQRPMVVRAAQGFGQLVFVAFDLDQPPFTGWEGQPRFIQRLVRESAHRADGQEGAPAPSAQFGYHDMSGQLRSALEQFPGVTLVAFSWVAGLVLLYIVLIGPVDYFLLRDVLRRMHWTWLSFPLLVIAFAMLAVVLNQRFRGGGIKVNQVDLVDVDEASGTVRGTVWSTYYSPAADVFDIELSRSGSADVPVTEGGQVITWHGLPGAALGGLDAHTSAIASASAGYQVAFPSLETSTMAGVPVAVASTRSLIGRWWGDWMPPHRAALTVDTDGLLRGEIVNPLPYELTECMVYYENWVYRLDSRRGVLAAGARTRIDVERALNLQWRLSGRRVVNTHDVGTPWDEKTLDIPKILEMMMFHGAVGGEIYTHLSNQYQGYVDLSQHLRTGRAILLGRARTPATQLKFDGDSVAGSDDQRQTYYRVIFPVEPAA
jgi:hypothetical protein